MSIKQEIKEYVSFTKGERKGIVVLLIIILIVSLINIFSDSLYKKKEVDFLEFKKEIALFESSLITLDTNRLNSSVKFVFDPNQTTESDWDRLGLQKKQIQTINNYLQKGGRFILKSDLRKIYGISEADYLELEPYIDLPETYGNQNHLYDGSSIKKNRAEMFYFDPNRIGDEEWMRLGFTAKQVQVIRKYIDAGGKFHKREDLKKLYVISEEKYDEINEFVVINEEEGKEINMNDNLADEKYKRRIDINSMNQEQIIELGGNWKYYGQRIVKYRNLLGGFYTKEQLLEVYGFREDFYDEISGLIEIDETKIQKLNVNFIEKEELAKHPYISDEAAKKIIVYRNNRGALKDIKELYYNNIIDSETYEKVKYYLRVN